MTSILQNIKPNTEYCISVNGQKAVDLGYKLQGNKCYTGLVINNERIAQIEVVVDWEGEHNGRPNKWVDFGYIKSENVETVMDWLIDNGFSDCFAIIIEETDDGQRKDEVTFTIPTKKTEEKNMKTLEQKQQETIEKIITYFKENDDVFEEVIQDLNSYSGFLGDNEIFEMEMLNEIYANTEPLELLYRVFYGHDSDNYTTDSSGNKTYSEFNPNRDYFYFNGYGNLVSCDSKDYSDYLDKYFVNELIDNYFHLYTLNYPAELDELIEEYENLEDDEEEESEEEENENV